MKKILLTTVAAFTMMTATPAFADVPQCHFFQASCDLGYEAGLADGINTAVKTIADTATADISNLDVTIINHQYGEFAVFADVATIVDMEVKKALEGSVPLEDHNAAIFAAQQEIISAYQETIKSNTAIHEAAIAEKERVYNELLKEYEVIKENRDTWKGAALNYINKHLRVRDVIADHKAQAGKNFEADPVGYMTFVFEYIEGLQEKLGLR